MRFSLTVSTISTLLERRGGDQPYFASGVEVSVFERGANPNTDEPVAVHSAQSGGVVLAQPLLTDLAGRIEGAEGQEVWVDSGSYDLSIDGEIMHWDTGAGAGDLEELSFNIGMGKVQLTPSEDADKDTERLQEGLGNESPNEVELGGGGFRANDTLTLESFKRLSGAGQGVTTITVEDGANCDLLTTAGYASTDTVTDIEISKLTLDGNRTKNTAKSGILSDASRLHLQRLVVVRFGLDGIAHRMSDETGIHDGGLDSTGAYLMVADCGHYGMKLNAHDTSLYNCQAIQCSDTGFFWEANGYMHTCHSWNWDSSIPAAMKTGMRLAVDVHCFDCTAEGATGRQVLIAENSIQWIGGELFNSVNAPNAHLFEVNGGTSPFIIYPNCHDFGTGGAVHFATTGQGAVILMRAFDNEDEAVTGTPHEEIYTDITTGGTTKLSNVAPFKRKKITFISGALTEDQNKTIGVDTDGRFKFKDANGTIRDFQMNAKETVASAATIAFSARASLMELTGTAEVKKITATYAGHRISVWMTGACKLLDEAAEGNLKLSGNLEGAGVKIVDLVCDGTNWRQTAPMVTL